jgi:hypothetical protein
LVPERALDERLLNRGDPGGLRRRKSVDVSIQATCILFIIFQVVVL